MGMTKKALLEAHELTAAAVPKRIFCSPGFYYVPVPARHGGWRRVAGISAALYLRIRVIDTS
jgi:hypothetical protein